MHSKAYFEVQKFNQSWIKVTLTISLILMVGLAIFNYRKYHAISPSFLIPLLLIAALVIVFAFAKLSLTIEEDKISYSFFPFIRKKAIAKDEILKIEVRAFDPIREFGGWGIRFGRTGTALTTSGVSGLFIKKENKERQLIIGTQNPEAVVAVLKTFGYLL